MCPAAPKQIIHAGVPKDLGIWWEETDTRISGDLFCEKGRDGSTHREPWEQGFSLGCVEFSYLPRLSFCYLAVRAEHESGAEMQRAHTGKTVLVVKILKYSWSSWRVLTECSFCPPGSSFFP